MQCLDEKATLLGQCVHDTAILTLPHQKPLFLKFPEMRVDAGEGQACPSRDLISVHRLLIQCFQDLSLRPAEYCHVGPCGVKSHSGKTYIIDESSIVS